MTFPWKLARVLVPATLLAGVGAIQACSDETSGSSDDGGSSNTSNAGGAGAAGGAGGSAGGAGGAGAAADNCPPDPTGQIPAMRLTQVADAASPVFVAGAPGDPLRLYVVERSGRIQIYKDGIQNPAPFLDVSGLNSCCGERGLLGLAFHPGFVENGRFFVYYTDEQGDIQVAEYRRSADPEIADAAAVQPIITVAHPQYGNHNGGMIAFGADGMLYVGVGDGGGGGDPFEAGQDMNEKRGKMLRVDVDAMPPGPAAGNMSGGDPYVWDYGLRNPWRFSFDRCLGDLYIADVGQDAWEEVNVEPAGMGHNNYGWNNMEGTHCFDPQAGCDEAGIVLPVTEYNHGEGASITGGYVYRGTKIPNLVGTYLYGDYASGFIRWLQWKNGGLVAEGDLTDDLLQGMGAFEISSFGQDAAGELYVVDLGGPIYRIDPE